MPAINLVIVARRYHIYKWRGVRRRDKNKKIIPCECLIVHLFSHPSNNKLLFVAIIAFTDQSLVMIQLQLYQSKQT
jgi:hypothetical protein